MSFGSHRARRKDAKAARKTLDSIFGPETRIPRTDERSVRGRAEKARRQEGVSRGTGGNPLFRSNEQKRQDQKKDTRPWWDKNKPGGGSSGGLPEGRRLY